MHSTTALLMTVHDAVHRCMIDTSVANPVLDEEVFIRAAMRFTSLPPKGSQGQPEGLLKMHPSRSWKSGVSTTEGGLAPCALPDTRSRI